MSDVPPFLSALENAFNEAMVSNEVERIEACISDDRGGAGVASGDARGDSLWAPDSFDDDEAVVARQGDGRRRLGDGPWTEHWYLPRCPNVSR
jgi:hypothetical protein